MLAKLLQRFLLALVIAGVGLAMLWHGATGDMLIATVLLPWLAVVLSTAYTMLKSRAPAEPAGAFYRAWWGETVANFRTFVLRQPWADKRPPYCLLTRAPPGCRCCWCMATCAITGSGTM